MKRIICIVLGLCFALNLFAQLNDETKPATLAFHVFYNDFKTAQQIRTSSLGNVLNNHSWSNIGDMQMGFGFNYLKGISKKFDFVGTLDGSSTDYLFKDGTTHGSSALLLDANAGLNIKLLTDSHVIAPYIFAGAGLSLYNSRAGVYLPAGAGLQFNIFNEAFVFTNMQYRYAVSPAANNHFQYSIGIGASIGKKKKTPPPVIPVKAAEPVVAPQVVKTVVKDLLINVTDEQSGLPLVNVEVSVNGPNGKISGLTDANGQVTFSAVQAADYTVSGTLHGIATSINSIAKNSFEVDDKEIKISLSHNDTRFTLTGQITNKSTHQPEGDVTVNMVNTTQNSSTNVQSQTGDGAFSMQLEAGSDFTVSGKKAGYISNIEKVSTKGLNRSTTLYVKLELGIEQALLDKTISLANIYYDTGSAKIRSSASSDLEKLVRFLKDNPDLKIEIASHTDSRGSDARNLKLSQARAQQVVNYLQKNGIDKSRLVPKGYGETRLINGCGNGVKCTEAQHEQNRRTEFKVIGK